VFHVVNYNATAQLEHRTHIFTRIIGNHAIYFYAVYLVCSALLRDHVINLALEVDTGVIAQLTVEQAHYAGLAFFAFGILLNIWTLKALGIKGMYNGDSFGFLMDAPVTSGPYVYFNDPQYVGTTLAMLGSALYYRSVYGLILTAVMGLVFYISVKFIEGPHLTRIYSARDKRKKAH